MIFKAKTAGNNIVTLSTSQITNVLFNKQSQQDMMIKTKEGIFFLSCTGKDNLPIVDEILSSSLYVEDIRYINPNRIIAMFSVKPKRYPIERHATIIFYEDQFFCINKNIDEFCHQIKSTHHGKMIRSTLLKGADMVVEKNIPYRSFGILKFKDVDEDRLDNIAFNEQYLKSISTIKDGKASMIELYSNNETPFSFKINTVF